ncbi:polysaccharide pyruvyl transferase CsaB [Geminocystis herdmanii]|uniref:polysaccharide pyruvyl transferase CsaB n=1 Tax=Geminocystis herdmanii TaxID=669359 RepID=UPI000346E7C4|nr:polysaccharide pyruvyl transferase CsaB [Geminocystis herdmanii]
MRKAIICGYYGQGNAGDEALLLAILERLPNNIKPIILSGNPLKTSKDYGVISYSRQGIIKQIFKLGKKDLFIWGGGSLIQDITSIKSPLFYLGLMILAQLKGLKTIAYAQGIGPIKTPFIQWLTKQVLKRCSGVSVRDRESAKLMEAWGIKYFIGADPVWALSAKISQDLDLLPSPRIGVNVRLNSSLNEAKLEIIIQSLKRLQQQTLANIILIPFQESKDLEICQKIGELLTQNYQIVNLENPQELKGLFRELDLMIGMRLHSLIMASSEKCPCFALSYDPKVTNLMKEIDIDGYELDNFPTDVQTITKKWLKIYHNQPRLSDDNLDLLEKNALKHQTLLDIFDS